MEWSVRGVVHLCARAFVCERVGSSSFQVRSASKTLATLIAGVSDGGGGGLWPPAVEVRAGVVELVAPACGCAE